MSHMGLYALNPTPKQRYNSYKGEMNGTCKNFYFLINERISILEKHILIETLKLHRLIKNGQLMFLSLKQL